MSLTTNGLRIFTQTGGSSKLQYEWHEHGDMRKFPPESIQPSPTQTAPQPPTPTAGPSPHITPYQRDHRSPSTQKRTAGGGPRWQYGRTEDDPQRAYAVMNGGPAAKKIVPNSVNPANRSASYEEELSFPVPPYAATNGRRRRMPPELPFNPCSGV